MESQSFFFGKKINSKVRRGLHKVRKAHLFQANPEKQLQHKALRTLRFYKTIHAKKALRPLRLNNDKADSFAPLRL